MTIMRVQKNSCRPQTSPKDHHWSVGQIRIMAVMIRPGNCERLMRAETLWLKDDDGGQSGSHHGQNRDKTGGRNAKRCLELTWPSNTTTNNNNNNYSNNNEAVRIVGFVGQPATHSELHGALVKICCENQLYLTIRKWQTDVNCWFWASEARPLIQ